VQSVGLASDGAVARATPLCKPPLRPRLALAGVTAAAGLVFIDGSVIVVGLPHVGRDLVLEGSQLQWVLNAYLLPLATLSMLGGAMGDRIGRRRMLLLGIALFCVGTIFCSEAWNFASLIGARFVQGLGAALLLPNSLSAIGQMFSGKEEGRAVGVWSAFAALVSALSPPIAGWLIDHGQWRPIFLLSLPLSILAAICIYRYVPDESTESDRPLDFTGSLLGATGLAVLVWQMTTEPSAAGLLWALSILIAFVILERKLGPNAVVPFGPLTSRTLLAVTLFTFCLYAAFNLFLVFVPYVLLKALHRSGMATGLVFIPLQAGFIVIAPFMGRVAATIGPRVPLAVGALFSGAGCLAAVHITQDPGYWSGLFPAVVLMAIGLSVCAVPLTTLVLTSVRKSQMGVASGINSAVTRLGALASTAMLSGILGESSSGLLAAYPTVMMGAAVACAFAAASTALIPRR
jgi:MFS family permease